ncbi:chromatin remodelling complex Rsc7/Swp82 subunit-domain-containing protein [Lanmaoa asiatica]|nr:chromatin remodelling complex Rsc7/Swp82 subunit-domain-containing protein [Lanmaoa asiatica]
MLAIDAARSSGFRDSLYYFRRNSLALKLSASQLEKEALIQAGKLGAHLKTRSVTLVTARSAYKLHGAKMIIGECVCSFARSEFKCRPSSDGRWVTDDYYENRVLADITAKGLSSGDFVGELPDPTATSASNAPAISAPSQTFSGTNQGVYRAGGPTTLFGGSGWGPFSDGPHSAVRKSMLSREGLTGDNWMWEAARRVHEMNTEWAKMRQDARIACGGVLEGNSSSGKGKEKEVNGAMDVDGEGDMGQKKKTDDAELPLGVYEPHTGLVHCAFELVSLGVVDRLCCSSRADRADTQPTRSRWEQVAPLRVLGGTKVGNGAWALAWVDTCLELPGPNDLDPYVTKRDTLMVSLS